MKRISICLLIGAWAAAEEPVPHALPDRLDPETHAIEIRDAVSATVSRRELTVYDVYGR